MVMDVPRPDDFLKTFVSSSGKTWAEETGTAKGCTTEEARQILENGLESADRKLIKKLQRRAQDLLLEKVPPHERTIILRNLANENGLSVRDGEIMAITAKARRALQGQADALGIGDAFDLPDEDWLWDGVIAAGVPNLIVALQKVGKSALMAGLIASWHYGAKEFLGHPLSGPCPPVIIAGTDQNLSDWKKVLAPVGLMIQRDDGKWQLLPGGPIKQLWHRACPVYLDTEGTEQIAEQCKQWPGAIVWLDTFAALVSPLGLAEEKPEIAEPLYNLEELTQPYNATTVAIHHASKSRAHERASNASRNSNALPGAVSQIISLHWLNAEQKSDQRIVLSTEGRNSTPIEQIIEQIDRSQWTSHGSADELKEQQRLDQIERKLNDRQAEALDVVREQWEEKRQELTAASLYSLQLTDHEGQLLFPTERQARRSLDELQSKGLIDDRLGKTAGGKSGKFYRPAGADLSRARAEI